MISRHIFWELLKATAISVSFLTILLLYGNLTRYEDVFFKAIEQNSPLILKLTVLLVPYSLSMAIPFGFTLALSLVVGNWASNREVKALNALGVSSLRTFIPFCFLSIFLSFLTIFSSLQWGPENRAAFDKLREEILWQNLSHLLVEDGEVSYNVGSASNSLSKQSLSTLTGNQGKNITRVSLSVKDFKDNIWKNLRITLFDKSDRILMVIHSGIAIVQKSYAKGLLTLNLYDVDLEPVQNNKNFFQGGSDIFVNIAHWQQPLAIEIGQGDKKNLKRLGFAELYKISTESKVGTEKIKAKAILHKNAALGFSPFFICLLVAPISVKIGRKETILNLFLGILVCVSFYTLGTIGSNFFEKYSWSYLSWWIPNIFFFFISALFCLKLLR